MCAADPDRPKTTCIFITDENTKTKFLIDTGADVWVYLKSHVKDASLCNYELYATNGTRIKTYGTVIMSLNFLLRQLRNRTE